MFALIFVGAVVGFEAAALRYGFIPADFIQGAWQSDPLRSWLSPLASLFLPLNIISAIFSLVFLLIAGRFLEKAIGPVGLAVTIVVAAYAGAAGRLLLTPGSPIPSAGFDTGLFGVIGCYFMLYGVPAALPINPRFGRVAQIAILAAVWIAFQLTFLLVGGAFELSATIVGPIFGLIAGVALARPLLAWRYRGA